MNVSMELKSCATAMREEYGGVAKFLLNAAISSGCIFSASRLLDDDVGDSGRLICRMSSICTIAFWLYLVGSKHNQDFFALFISIETDVYFLPGDNLRQRHLSNIIRLWCRKVCELKHRY
jgi:hypothetical protein